MSLRYRNNHYEYAITSIFPQGTPAASRIHHHQDVFSVMGNMAVQFTMHNLKCLYTAPLNLEDVLALVGKHDHSHERAHVALPIAPYTIDYLYGVTPDSTLHWYLGCLKRIVVNHPVNQLVMGDFAAFYRRQVEKMDPIPHIDPSHELLDEKWLNGSKYTRAEKKNFHRDLDRYLSNGCLSAGAYACKSFIKRELYDEPKYARIINSRSDIFKAVTAPYVKFIEDQVYDEHFIKHHLPSWTVERMKEIHAKYGQITETDYSSFEGSFTEQALIQCEKHLFKHMLQNNPQIWKIVKQSFNCENKLMHSSGVTLFTRGTRMSGEMWTSLGNGFMNKMLMEFTMHVNETTGDYLVEGDDGFIATTKKMDWGVVQALGFSLKSEFVNDINDMSFCGIAINSEGKPTGDIMKQLKRFGYTNDSYMLKHEILKTRKYHKREKMLVRAKALSAAATFKGAPILWKICQLCLDATNGVTPTRDCFDWWEWDTFGPSLYDGCVEEPTESDRLLFYDKSGVSPGKQRQIESEITRLHDSFYI